jgi:UDP-GlcNAc:undecaprenyl-phosphate/decaprenyl-phosphate GlcNAc-1-phosphate transferase
MKVASALVGFAFSLPLSWLSLTLGRRLRLLDRPSSIKIHPSPVPYTGGAAIVLTICLAGALLGSPAPPLVGLVLAWLIGLIDDVKGLAPIRKLVLLLSCLAVGTFGLELEPQARMVVLFAGLVLVNAFNVIDGLDGLAGGVAIFGFMALAVADSNWASLAAVGLGAVAALPLFNLHPAAMFLGNQGSLAVGYFLWIAPAHLYSTQRDGATITYAVLMWAFPLLNLGFVVSKRALERRPMFVGDRSHLYDVLHRRLGLRATLLLCWLFAAVCAVAAVAVVATRPYLD